METKKNFFIIYESKRYPIKEATSDVSIDELISATVAKLRLPEEDASGNAVKYKLIFHRTGKTLPEASTLAGVDIQEQDELELVSEIVVGEKPSAKGVSQEIVDAINFSAPVQIPDRQSLTRHLVPTDIVYRLEEYRSDQRRWEAIMWAFIGAILGIIINWVTADPLIITRTSLIVLGTFMIMAIINGLAVREYKSRANKMRIEMLKFDSGSKSTKETE